MKDNAGEYNVLIFPYSEAEDKPSSEIHAEIGGNFEKFYENFIDWLGAFCWYRKYRNGGKAKFRIRGGENDMLVCCDEAEVILSFIYCCEDHDVTIKEIVYQENRYTDISDIRFRDACNFVADDWYTEMGKRTIVRLDAKKNGCDTQIYLFGPVFHHTDSNNAECLQIDYYPRSYGMVETNERQMYYVGTHVYHKTEYINPDDYDQEYAYLLNPGYHEYTDGVDIFLEIEGENVTFSALLNGRLYKKISKDDEKVIFYSALYQNVLLGEDSFWEHIEEEEDALDVIFKVNCYGRYQYDSNGGASWRIAKRLSGGIFAPPPTPVQSMMDEESAKRLCKTYMDAFCGKKEAKVSEDKKIWKKFWGILEDIHNRYGLTAEEKAASGQKGAESPDSLARTKKTAYGSKKTEDKVTAVEVLFAVCIFFSMEEKELEEFLTTEKMRETYGVLKIAVEEMLNRDINRYNEKAYTKADRFDYREMREVFASDFAHINRLTYVKGKQGSYPELPGQPDWVSQGEAFDYEAICSLVFIAGSEFFERIYGDAFPIIQYYRTKAKTKAKTKKGTDAVLSMKKRLIKGLKEKIKGQDMAVEKFVDGYIRYQRWGKEAGKPAGLYLFAGPPGTGKTYLAETFAKLKDVAEEGYRYKRFDMSAYGSETSDSVSGLVGFERTWKSAEPGQLTDFVKRNPKCILLFDEIEKAGKQVRMLFLSVMEGARLVDKYYDEAVSFEDAILIFTTNEGKDLYEDNRGMNLTALSDSTVIDALQESKFAPELISRFMSGTVVMFNHLDYFHMSNIFKDSLDATLGKICKNEKLDFVPDYDDRLPMYYLMGKGDRIDARYVHVNTKKTAEDYFLAAAEWMKKYHPGRFKILSGASVSIEVTDQVRNYFERSKNPRILIYAEGNAGLFIGGTDRRRELLSGKEPEKLERIADCIFAKDAEDFREILANCNWNSKNGADKFDAVLVDPGGSPGIHDDAEGYKCLKAASEARRDIPVMVVDRGTMEDKTLLFALGVTDFVQGDILWRGEEDIDRRDLESGDLESGDLILDQKALEAVFDRQYFVTMATELVRKGKRISGDVLYEYKKERTRLEIRFVNLCVKEAVEEDAEARRQNKKYLLAEKPQKRLDDIFGSELVKEEVRLCIDNIKHPEKYRKLGVKLMTGILMYGAAGTGKTIFAKAMAFEANAAFISITGSDFLNGDGVSKMEEIFKTARRKRPCIIFIDEFDAISKNRNTEGMAAMQEAVLEKFLKEMDGLDTDNDGVYVTAATNYPLERLDSAVARRFSVRLKFPSPTVDEQVKYLLWLLEDYGLQDILTEKRARALVHMMGGTRSNYSEIKKFIEQSMMQAAYKNEDVTEKFLIDRIHNETYGSARRGRDIVTAYHEAGHAVLMYRYGKEVEYVTIVSRGIYGGYARADSTPRTGQDFLNRINIDFAGRAAEVIYLGGREGINVGAEVDLQYATQRAYEYICQYGLDDNHIAVVTEKFGGYPGAVLPESEKERIWASVKGVLDSQWEHTVQLLKEEEMWKRVEAVAYSLLYMQELSGEHVKKMMETQAPYIDEKICFLDMDCDYIKAESGEEALPFGYPVYPFYSYAPVKLRPEEKNAAAGEGGSLQYFYTVKTAEEHFGPFDEFKEAFEKAKARDSALREEDEVERVRCRRFVSREAAQEYLDMLELKVCTQGLKRFCGFYVDALAEMVATSAEEKDLIVLKGGEVVRYEVEQNEEGITYLRETQRESIGRYQDEANERGSSLASCLMRKLANDFYEEHENAYRVIQIYDKELQDQWHKHMDVLVDQDRTVWDPDLLAALQNSQIGDSDD